MGYYLSEQDKIYIANLYPRLQESKDDIVLKTKNPRSLSYLIRNAFHTIPEWEGFKAKFKIITREDRVILKIKNINFELELETIIVGPDLFQILDVLIKNPEVLIVENISELPPSALIKLDQYCQNNNYDIISGTNNRIEIKKKSIRSE